MKKSDEIKCVVFDYANTLSSDHFFKTKPAQCEEWYELFQAHIFSDKKCVTDWCTGKLSSRDIAQKIQPFVEIPFESILLEMQSGCKNLSFNKAVMNFAKQQNQQNRKTALVTANIDLFSEIVVPYYQLDTIFDVIVNSADYKNDNKLELWPLAFDRLWEDTGYANSLLIDDSEKWIDDFKNCGGEVCLYKNDIDFEKWLLSRWSI